MRHKDCQRQKFLSVCHDTFLILFMAKTVKPKIDHENRILKGFIIYEILIFQRSGKSTLIIFMHARDFVSKLLSKMKQNYELVMNNVSLEL